MIVDAESSFGGMDIHPSDVHADIFVAGPSKCLGGAPGLTFVTVILLADGCHVDVGAAIEGGAEICR